MDAAKHLGKNIWTIWSSKKLELTDINLVEHRFFVRVAGDAAKVKKEAVKLFGDIEEVKAENVTGEYAFITPNITEQKMKINREKLSNVLSVIRVRF